MSLDRSIFKAIKGRPETQPQNLVGILGYVDSQERLVLTHEELSGGLQRLIESGKIAEAAPHQYFDPAGQPHATTFTTLTLEDHQKARDAYYQWFKEETQKLDNKEPSEDDFSRMKIAIRWKLEGERYAGEADEDAIEALADQLDPILHESQLAEIIGFEFGAGHIDMILFGKETDEDTDAIYTSIVAAFRAFGCPPGSYIIRRYEDQGEEVISDVVPHPG